MFDFGDELIFGSHRIPWLVWIQLLVMLLLIILLYYLSIFALGLDPSPNDAAALPSTALLSSNTQSSNAAAAAVTIRSTQLHTTKMAEIHSMKGDMTGTSTSRRRVRREDIQIQERDQDSSSAKDENHASILEQHSYHPCHYFGLAKQAFLKCLGLDPPSKDSSNTRHRKEQ